MRFWTSQSDGLFLVLEMKHDIEQKYRKKAQRWAHFLVWMPGVSAIFLSGSLAQGKATESSDIDFFIVAESGQIFTARFFVATFLKLFRQLAHNQKNHAGKICPNHFVTDDYLEIKEQDEYAARLFSHNEFLAGEISIWEEFISVNKDWIKSFGFSFVNSFPTCNLKKIEPQIKTNWVLQKLENWCKNYQLKRFAKKKQALCKNAKVWFTDTEIRLHPNPKNKVR